MAFDHRLTGWTSEPSSLSRASAAADLRDVAIRIDGIRHGLEDSAAFDGQDLTDLRHHLRVAADAIGAALAKAGAGQRHLPAAIDPRTGEFRPW